MVSNTQIQPIENSRHIDPDVQQRLAANPESSVWVGASAGSGKTKVLTDRVLRLLLPDKNGLNAVNPQKILALTFTKAAASEMALRINKELSKWAVMPIQADTKDKKEYLFDALEYLLGYPPTQKQLEVAKQLFAKVIDVPGGLKIMTIHSFCTSVLGRFPLEAGLSPNFKAVEENETAPLLQMAIQTTVRTAQQEKGSDMAQAFHNLALSKNEEEIDFLIKKITSERRQITKILKDNFGAIGLYTNLCKHFDIDDGAEKQSIITNACATSTFDEIALREACKALSEGTEKTDQPKGLTIQNWLDSDAPTRIKNFEQYQNIFFNANGEIYKNLCTTGIKNKNPQCDEALKEEAYRLEKINQTLSALNIATLTRDLFLLGDDILKNYTALKEKNGFLDYDDLILKTLDLLEGETKTLQNLPDVSQWIRYKLDQGIDHILVDEAQDTNPEQWGIINALTSDFFNDSSDDTIRTLFVVGDEKQSIYSFQRAAPEKFEDMRQFFSKKINDYHKDFDEVSFITSFRSTQAVLKFVDTIFQNNVYQNGLGHNKIEHQSFRRKQPGKVALWPLFKNPEKDDRNVWLPPTEIIDNQSGAQLLANHIGDTLQSWITEKRHLYSYDRAVQPKDIMILLRTRNAFLDQLVRALKTRNIPVNGVDRMVLNDQLVIQDMCAIAQFALLPDDNLTLAEILKSPFIGLSEEALFDLSYNRKKLSLWDKLRQSSHKEIYAWLNSLIQSTNHLSPYAFFASLLQISCPTDSESGLRAIKKRLGNEALDPIDEFLNTALIFEQNNVPNLQEFLVQQQSNTAQIKRELDDAGNMVRIMTIHGAKGLQAPIVIMPDTIRSASGVKKEHVLLPHQTGNDYPYFCPTSKGLPPSCEKALNQWEQKQDEEYRRLFYVAATRAESELYIGGYFGKNRPKKESWYDYAEYAFDNLENISEEKHPTFETPVLTYSNPETSAPDRQEEKNMLDKSEELSAPSWLHKPITHEDETLRALTPSRQLSNEEEQSLSPLNAKKENNRFKRGNIIHKLLQILPSINSSNWHERTKQYLSRSAHALTIKEQKEILEETLNILNHPEFKEIFGPNARAEVPISGIVNNNQLLSGQIDRLLITENEILIVDFKTNRPPPKDKENVPKIYLDQMSAYENALREIYPNRTIKKALIWTNIGHLMVLD